MPVVALFLQVVTLPVVVQRAVPSGQLRTIEVVSERTSSTVSAKGHGARTRPRTSELVLQDWSPLRAVLVNTDFACDMPEVVVLNTTIRCPRSREAWRSYLAAYPFLFFHISVHVFSTPPSKERALRSLWKRRRLYARRVVKTDAWHREQRQSSFLPYDAGGEPRQSLFFLCKPGVLTTTGCTKIEQGSPARVLVCK